jgi:hypothetical protein
MDRKRGLKSCGYRSPFGVISISPRSGGLSIDGGGTWSRTGLMPCEIISLLVFDPRTPTTIYAGVQGSCGMGGCSLEGVFKSTDGGDTWHSIGLTNRTVNAIAIDPVEPTTLYAGTAGGGVFKSTDGGGTWSGIGFTDLTVFALVIDPRVPTTLYAGTDAGVYKSADGGNTWNATGITDNVTALVVNPKTPTTLYAGRWIGGVFKSTDGGDTWSEISTGLSGGRVFALTVDPVEPSLVYAGTEGGGVSKSADGGGTWRDMNVGLTNRFVTALAIDPIEPRRLYAGTAGGGVFAIEQVDECAGDCDGDGVVLVDELITLVNIALGNDDVSACDSGDADGSGEVTVDELLTAVSFAIEGCPVVPPGRACLDSGGTVGSATCCLSTDDFPDTCAIGACGCQPNASHEVAVCDCGVGRCFDGTECVQD